MKTSLIILSLLFFIGCKKYEEGPSLSLISKKERIANTWKLDKFYENGTDKTGDAMNLFKDFVLIIDKNNMKYSKSFKALGLLPYGETGAWSFTSDKESIDFSSDNSTVGKYTWRVIRLKENSVGFTYTENGITYKVYLKP